MHLLCLMNNIISWIFGWNRRVLIVFGLVWCGVAVSPERHAIVYNGQHLPLSPPLQPHNWQRQSGIQSHFHSAESMSGFRGMHRWQRLYSSGSSPENSPNPPQNHIHIKLCSGSGSFPWRSCVSAIGRMRHEPKYADEFFSFFLSLFLTWSTVFGKFFFFFTF